MWYNDAKYYSLKNVEVRRPGGPDNRDSSTYALAQYKRYMKKNIYSKKFMRWMKT